MSIPNKVISYYLSAEYKTTTSDKTCWNTRLFLNGPPDNADCNLQITTAKALKVQVLFH